MDHQKLFAEIVARRTVKTQVPGQDSHEITVEQGQDKVAPSSAAGPSQVDASIRFSEAPAEASTRNKLHGTNTTIIEMPDSTPTQDDTLMVGNVTITRNKAQGYELQFSKDRSSFYVYVDGKKVEPSNAIEAIFQALKAERKGGGW